MHDVMLSRKGAARQGGPLPMFRIRRLVLVALTISAGAIASANGASASTITQPTGSPFVVTADASGATSLFTVNATGFAPGTLVYVEECDGVAPSAPLWSPTAHCDLGSSPAPAIADSSGAVSFAPTDRNRAFHAFVGESPQSLFNCLVPGQRAPSNGLASSAKCALRVSSNNTAITSDQTFLALAFTNGNVSTTSTTVVPAGSGTTVPTSTKHVPAKKPSRVAKSPTTSTTVTHDAAKASKPDSSVVGGVSTTHRADVGLLSFSDSDVAAGYVLLFGGLAISALTVSLRRRTPAAGLPVSDTKMPGER
jgi:hypothetical protein